MLINSEGLRHGRRTVLLAFLFASVLTGRLAATTIFYQVTPVGANVYQFNYTVADLALNANQELDIEFDPALYGLLSNGLAGAGFDLLLFQPDNPPGSVGLYAALALVNNPSLSGPFQVNAVYKGLGTPGPQPFSIARFNNERTLLEVYQSGSTTQGLPEPSAGSLTLLGLIAWGARRVFSMRRVRVTPVLTTRRD